MAFRDVEIDRRILPLVKVLNEKGYRTISSCEGHFDEETELWSKANVVFYAEKKKINRLKDVLADLIASDQINEIEKSDIIKNLYTIIVLPKMQAPFPADFRQKTDSILNEIVTRLSAEESVDYQNRWERRWKET